MRKKRTENKFFSYILCILIFFRFIFDGMTYPIFNLIFTISIILIFIFLVFLRLSELKITFLEILIFLFLIFSLLSTFLSEIKGTGIRYNSSIATYLCLFFLVRNIIKERKILINTLMCATLIITSYGIYQRFWGFEITRKSLMENPELFLHYSEFLKYLSPTFIDRLESNRIFSTFVYPNIYASFLISLMPLLFFIFVKEYKSYYGFFSIFLFILSLLNLIFTESMGGILIFFFIFHLIFLQFILEERKFKKFVPYVLIFEFILLIIGYQLKILPHIHSLLDRIGYWKASLKVVLLRPIIGVGPENFRYYFLKFKLPEGLETAHAHNLLIEILVENGVIGLFLFCVFIFNLLLDFWKNQMEILNRGIFYLLISFFLHNLIDFNFYDPSVAILFFIFGSPFEQKVKKVYSYNLLTKVVLYLIIIISIGVCFKLIRFENSERYRRYSEREINLNTKLGLLDIAQNWDKRNFEVFFQKGEIYISMWSLTREDNFLKESIINYEKAISLNPYLIKSYRRLAYIYETIGNYKEAEKYYIEVLKRYPNKKIYNLEIARYYKKIGENEKFKFYFEKSKHLQSVTKEEKIMVEEIEKWIELQK